MFRCIAFKSVHQNVQTKSQVKSMMIIGSRLKITLYNNITSTNLYRTKTHCFVIPEVRN